jgi:hypothetical protein
MSWCRRAVLGFVGGSAATLAGCAGTDPSEAPAVPPPPRGASYAYTHLQPSGNRVVRGSGSIVDRDPVDIAVEGRPAWLLAFGGADSYWTIVTADGRAITHRVSASDSEIVVDHGSVSTPPIGYAVDGDVGVVQAPADCAEYTHPVAIDGGLLYVAADGDVVLQRASGTTRLDVRAPADARLVELGGGRYALYGARTDRYAHGALGDAVEGASLFVVNVATGAVASDVTLQSPLVFEGLSPFAADLDDDGDPELVTTVADTARGARVRVYRTDGTELATGPIYGPGWRHQLCVAPFGPAGTPELAVVRKPHVDRTLEFYRLVDGGLRVVATHQGFASHTYGSRNLDGGLAGDLDGDGRTELLLPTTDRTALAAVRRCDGGARTVWTRSLGGSLRTNVTGVALDGDRVAIGAGTADGVRVWQG